jgi:hypothetical protein
MQSLPEAEGFSGSIQARDLLSHVRGEKKPSNEDDANRLFSIATPVFDVVNFITLSI